MISRQICGPRKIVLLNDDAIDQSESNLDEYRKTLFASGMKFHDGKTPTYFSIKPLTVRQKKHAYFLEGWEKIEFVVRCGLDGIENYAVLDDNGSDVGLSPITFANHATFGSMIEQKWMDSTPIKLKDFELLSTYILFISDAHPLL